MYRDDEAALRAELEDVEQSLAAARERLEASQARLASRTALAARLRRRLRITTWVVFGAALALLAAVALREALTRPTLSELAAMRTAADQSRLLAHDTVDGEFREADVHPKVPRVLDELRVRASSCPRSPRS